MDRFYRPKIISSILRSVVTGGETKTGEMTMTNLNITVTPVTKIEGVDTPAMSYDKR